MAQPPKYQRTKDFNADYGDQTDGQAINNELDAAAQSINGLRTNLALIQDDDGGLSAGIVTKDALDPSLKSDLYDEFSANVSASVTAAQQAAGDANTAAEAAQGYRDAAAASATAAAGSEAGATASQTAAAASAAAAGASATTASNAANSPQVQAVAAHIDDVTTVAADLANVNTVAENTASVTAVAADVANVNAVAADLANINTVAGAATDVQAVGENIDAVEFVGKDLTGAPIVIDYGSIADPPSNPAAPGGVLGAVYDNASNIATVAENIANVNTAAENIEAVTTPAISKLTDVDHTTAPTDGQILIYNAASGKWIPGAQSGGGSSVVTRWARSPNASTGSTSNAVLDTLTIPGGLMGAHSGVRVTALLTKTGSAGSATFIAYPGSASGAAFINYSPANNAFATNHIAGEFWNAGAVNSQIVQAGYGMIGGGGWGGTSSSSYTASVDTSQDFDITFVGRVAVSGDTLTLAGYIVEIIQ